MGPQHFECIWMALTVRRLGIVFAICGIFVIFTNFYFYQERAADFPVHILR